MIRLYLSAGILAAVAALGVYAMNRAQKVDTLQAQIAMKQAVLNACYARITNIEEDRASDGEIDSLSPADLARRASESLHSIAPPR